MLCLRKFRWSYEKIGKFKALGAYPVWDFLLDVGQRHLLRKNDILPVLRILRVKNFILMSDNPRSPRNRA